MQKILARLSSQIQRIECSASVLDHPLVNPLVLLRWSVPRKVLRHATSHHRGPLLLVAEGSQRTTQCIHQRRRTVTPELEAVTAAVGLLVDGVVETARCANHG